MTEMVKKTHVQVQAEMCSSSPWLPQLLHRQGCSLRVLHLPFCTQKKPPNSIAALALLSLVFFAICSWHEPLGAIIRPIWDKRQPFHHIPHYYAQNISMTTLCSLHGWTLRPRPRRVFDAIIFNNELDLLELRWRELAHVVSRFIILESNTTFTGQGKALWFSANRERFAFVESQTVYADVEGRQLKRGESPFVLEHAQRGYMDKVLQEAGIVQGDLLIMSDVDEIPQAHTINILRWCNGIPSVMHLQMSTYLYSFDFFVGKDTWRPSAHVYRPGKTKYAHGRQSDLILADAGWHCSFCFRHIEDIVFKMQAYSHADRVKSRKFLEPQRVQAIVCEGRDLFGMLPEAHSYKELISKSGAVPRSNSGVNLPSFLLNNQDRFKYLLPGNCMRQLYG